jgi:crotonobetainyl-CoA:carnitine CoA-transferase CaiB-like acyl-CoA transferase
VNRGKHCIVLDVHQDGGKAELADLCEWADVLVTNFTQPGLRRMGLDAESLGVSAPHLTYAYLNAFGTTGPWADLRGYAEIAIAVTGITARTVANGGPPSGVAPNVDLPRMPFTDYAAAVLGAFGVLAGLYRRSRTGRSSFVETSLIDAANIQQLQFLVAGAEAGSDAGWTDLQRICRTGDGWVFIGLAERHRARLLSLLGIASTEETPERIEAALASRPSVEVCRLLAEAGGSAQPVAAVDALLERGGPADLRGLRLEHDSTEFGTVVQPGPVIRMDRTPMRGGGLPVSTPSPLAGESGRLKRLEQGK